MATHTPWEACGNFVRTARRPEDMSGIIIAECNTQFSGACTNATLMAAAPELLAALRAALPIVESHPAYMDGATERQIRAAIRKAEVRG